VIPILSKKTLSAKRINALKPSISDIGENHNGVDEFGNFTDKIIIAYRIKIKRQKAKGD